MNPTEIQALRALQLEQSRIRISLAVVLLSVTCLFALLLSWLAQDTPLGPLLLVKASLYALLAVYGVSVGAAAIYARWIRVRREPVLNGIKSSGLQKE
jgi:hypothetical protein